MPATTSMPPSGENVWQAGNSAARASAIMIRIERLMAWMSARPGRSDGARAQARPAAADHRARWSSDSRPPWRAPTDRTDRGLRTVPAAAPCTRPRRQRAPAPRTPQRCVGMAIAAAQRRRTSPVDGWTWRIPRCRREETRGVKPRAGSERHEGDRRSVDAGRFEPGGGGFERRLQDARARRDADRQAHLLDRGAEAEQPAAGAAGFLVGMLRRVDLLLVEDR